LQSIGTNATAALVALGRGLADAGRTINNEMTAVERSAWIRRIEISFPDVSPSTRF
jgi:hypothetical protein